MSRVTEGDGAVYVRLGEGRTHRTRELSPGEVFADYDRGGRLLGVEVLPPAPGRRKGARQPGGKKE